MPHKEHMNTLIIRLSIFVGTFISLAIWEVLTPRRERVVKRTFRWGNNLGIVVLNNIIVYAIPFAPIAAALLAGEQEWGLFNILSVPGWVSIIACILILDVLIYLQHLAFHRVGLLWALHKMHHIDTEVDITTALRFHPIEIVLSLGIKIGAVIALGADPLAVLIFESLLNSSAMFNHANAYIPLRLDHLLRSFLVTPDMHRIHHSTKRKEMDSNFGFFLSWWDRLFNTYTRDPMEGQLLMKIGVPGFLKTKYQYFHMMLGAPFIKGETQNNQD
jgi:sterol desaturase/sphingolipid hydroxylase (fatty acid hydroxylase superfamily)